VERRRIGVYVVFVLATAASTAITIHTTTSTGGTALVDKKAQ
jgi:hypothetical protein